MPYLATYAQMYQSVRLQSVRLSGKHVRLMSTYAPVGQLVRLPDKPVHLRVNVRLLPAGSLGRAPSWAC